jgi:hypothetical protein
MRNLEVGTDGIEPIEWNTPMTEQPEQSLGPNLDDGLPGSVF